MTRTGIFLVVCVAALGFGGCGSSPQGRAHDSGTNGPDGGRVSDQGGAVDASADSATGDSATGDSAIGDSATGDAGCDCPASEPCCDDACGFRPATYRCQGPDEATRVRSSCDGTCRGAATPEFEVQYCSGTSAACDGVTAWEDNVLCGIVPPCSGMHTCDSGERCVALDPMPVEDFASVDMLCEPHVSCGL